MAAGEVTIGKGVIPIRADIKPLLKGVKDAAQAVSRLTGRGAIGSVNGLAGAVVGLGNAFAGMASTANRAITGLGEALSSGLSGSIGGVGQAIAGVVGTLGEALSGAAKAAGDLASAGVKAIGGLASAAASLIPHVGETVAAAVSGVAGLIATAVQTAATAISGLVSVVTTAISSAIRAAASLVEAAASMLGRLLQSIADTALKVGGIVAAAAAAMGFGIYKAVHAASDLNETIQKTEVVFGEATKSVSKAADEMARSLGIPRREFLDSAASIGLIAKAAGLSQAASADLSIQLAKLGADAASFYNVPLQEALVSMRAGLVGESEPLRRFGVLLNEDAVKAEALRLGIVKSTKALTEGQKVQARASLIFAGMTDASGDLARTADSLANRTRELSGRFHTLMETIGQAFLPAAQAITGGLSKLTGHITAWVEANKIQFEGFVDYLASLGNAIGNVFSKWETYRKLAVSAFQDIADSAKAVFAALPGLISSAVQGAVPLFKSFAGMFKGLADYVVDLFAQVAMAIRDHLKNAVADAMVAMAGPLNFLTRGGSDAMVTDAINSKVVPHKVRPKALSEFVKGDEVTEAAGKFGEALRIALNGAVANFAGILGRIGFSEKTNALAKEVSTPEKAAEAPKKKGSAVDRLNEQNRKRGLIIGPSAESLAKLGSGVYDPISAFKANPSGIAGSMLMPGFGGIASQAGFLAKSLGRGPTKREQDATTSALLTPGFAGAAAQAKLIGQRLMPTGIFKGTEKQAEKILAAREKRAAQLEARKLEPVAIGKKDDASKGADKFDPTAQLNADKGAFKSEFLGLEDFAKKIQTNILGGGDDPATKTARNTERTAKAVETLANRAAAVPVAVAQ